MIDHQGKDHHKIKDSLSGEHKVAIGLEDRVIDRFDKPIIVKRNHENDLSSLLKLKIIIRSKTHSVANIK